MKNPMPLSFNRRSFLRTTGLAGTIGLAQCISAKTEDFVRKPTRFQIACMTLPYSKFPFERALKGIKAIR